MTIIELLMTADIENLTKRPTATLEVKSLSEKLGAPFIITVKALSSIKFMGLTSIALKNDNTADMSKMPDVQALIVVEGMIDPNLRDKDLQEHFGVKTPKDLALKLFNGGDLAAISNYITELSGYGESSVAQIKN